MKTVEQLIAEHNMTSGSFEETKVVLTTEVERKNSKLMAIKGVIASYELKLKRANIELEDELEAINSNFKQI